MSRDKRSSYWFITINPNALCYNDFTTIINTLYADYPYLEYSYIYHNIKEDDDNFNENHIHCVLYFKSSVRGFNSLKKLFNGAHIEMTNRQRYKRTVQYLIHKNEINKHKYNINDIITNINTVEFNEIICSDGYDFELFESTKLQRYMFECVTSSNPTIYYFINRFGIDAIKQYYFIIKDLLKYEQEVDKSLTAELLKDDIISDSGLII